MKIAILTPTFHYYSGIDRVSEKQAEDFTAKGSEVTVYCLEASIKPKGYKVVEIGMPKNEFLQRIYRLFFFMSRDKINKYGEQMKDYEIVISHLYPMNIIASQARKKYNFKYVYYNHGVGYPELFTNFLEKLYMAVFLRLTNWSIKNADSAISVSKFLKDELKRESGIDSEVAYNEIDSNKFRKGIDGSAVRKKLGISHDEKVILFVGRMSPHKNLTGLIKMFKILRKKFKNAKLVVVGKPTFRKYYKALRKAAKSGVLFREFVDDEELPHYYAACDVYATCSLWEGFDLPAAEAQACGKPVVAFGICSHPEIVKNGILVKKNDIKGFAKAIMKIFSEEDGKPKNQAKLQKKQA